MKDTEWYSSQAAHFLLNQSLRWQSQCMPVLNRCSTSTIICRLVRLLFVVSPLQRCVCVCVCVCRSYKLILSQGNLVNISSCRPTLLHSAFYPLRMMLASGLPEDIPRVSRSHRSYGNALTPAGSGSLPFPSFVRERPDACGFRFFPVPIVRTGTP